MKARNEITNKEAKASNKGNLKGSKNGKTSCIRKNEKITKPRTT